MLCPYIFCIIHKIFKIVGARHVVPKDLNVGARHSRAQEVFCRGWACPCPRGLKRSWAAERAAPTFRATVRAAPTYIFYS